MGRLHLAVAALLASGCGGAEDLTGSVASDSGAPDRTIPVDAAGPATSAESAAPSGDGGSSDVTVGTVGDGGSAGDAQGTASDDAADDAQGPTADPVVLATPDGGVTAVAVVGSNVYFSVYDMGIYAVPTAGGATTQIVSPAASTGTFDGEFEPFAFDSTSVYWAANCYGTCTPTIDRAPITGGATTVVAQAATGYIAGIAVDGANVYWLDQDSGEVLSAPVTGGSAVIVASGLTTPAAIAIHDGTIYLTDAASDLLSVPEVGGAVTTLVKGPGLAPNIAGVGFFSVQLAVDDTNVYYPQYYAPVPIVAKVPLDGGALTALANAYASGIVVDGADVFWMPGGGSGETVNEVPVAGPPGRVLAVGQPAPVGPAVDSTSVYWGTSQYTTPSCGLCSPSVTLGANAVKKIPR